VLPRTHVAANLRVPAWWALAHEQAIAMSSQGGASESSAARRFALPHDLKSKRRSVLVMLAAVSFSIAGVVSLLTGGSSLPLKLQEAPITFVIGLVLLIAPMIGRPIPLARLMRVPSPNKNIDSSVGVLIGGFLVLHALLHLTLAVSLSTSSFVVLSKVIDWGTVALAILASRSTDGTYKRQPPRA
jgi:hypothetical protein